MSEKKTKASGIVQKDETMLIEESINEIINQAVNRGASDIHLEPREGFLLIRFRIDGRLREANRLPKIFEVLLIEHIKHIAGLKLSERRLPQLGSFDKKLKSDNYSFKVSSLPTVDGEKIVIKLLKENGEFNNFRDLGVWGDNLKVIENSILKNKGLIIIGGPASSGKSSLVNIILNNLSTPTVNISSLEKVVQIKLKGVNQIELGSSHTLSFANSLKSLHDQDTNIIYIEEITDLDTLEIALELASAGKLLILSLNGNSLNELLSKLDNLGINKQVLANETLVLSCQKLIRKLCLNCRVEYQPNNLIINKVLKDIGLSESHFSQIHGLENEAIHEGLGKDLKDNSSDKKTINRLFKAGEEGCKDCNYTGYKGRTGVFDVLDISKNKDKLINLNAKNSKKVINYLLIDGLIKVLRGITSLEEVFQVI